MNIDTLNAYCGRKLAFFPYLAQGRLNIHQAACCLHWAAAVLFCTAQLQGMPYGVYRLDSWELASWVGDVAVCAWRGDLIDCPAKRQPILTFDLRLDKITRRI